jgi:hypothetical protein
MNPQQWVGAMLLIFSIALIIFEKKTPPQRYARGWLHWLSPPNPSKELPN